MKLSNPKTSYMLGYPANILYIITVSFLRNLTESRKLKKNIIFIPYNEYLTTEINP